LIWLFIGLGISGICGQIGEVAQSAEKLASGGIAIIRPVNIVSSSAPETVLGAFRGSF
jgi:hypothetical protein